MRRISSWSLLTADKFKIVDINRELWIRVHWHCAEVKSCSTIKIISLDFLWGEYVFKPVASKAVISLFTFKSHFFSKIGELLFIFHLKFESSISNGKKMINEQMKPTKFIVDAFRLSGGWDTFKNKEEDWESGWKQMFYECKPLWQGTYRTWNCKN